MFSSFENIHIAGMSTCMPENIVRNTDYASVFGEKEVRKQIKVTGMEERRCLIGDQDVIDLSCQAVDAVMKHTRWSGDDIDVIIYVSAYHRELFEVTADRFAQQVQAKQSCLCFDINLGCSSFVNGMFTMASLIERIGNGAKGLLVVSDSTSIGGDHDDKTVSMLSGDCGTATAVEFKKGSQMLFSQYMDGSRYDCIVRRDVEHNLIMDGMAVFNFAITDVVEAIKEFFDHYQLNKDDFDGFVLHQAQKFIVDKVAQFASLPKDKVLISYDKHGNTGGPSLPTTLCVNRAQYPEENEINVFFAGFGSGLSWGFISTGVEMENVLEPIYTDDRFELVG